MRVNWGRDLKPPPSPSPWPFLRLLLASGAPEPLPLVDVWWDSGCTVFQRRGIKKSTGDVAVCYGSGTQLWRPLKKRTLLSGQCILERPRCCYLTLALWNLYRSSCFPKTFETKGTPHTLYSLPGHRVDICWCSIPPGPTGPESCFHLGPCILHGSGSDLPSVSLILTSHSWRCPTSVFDPFQTPKEAITIQKSFLFEEALVFGPRPCRA